MLRAALQRELSIAVSVPLMLEYEAVLTRPEHLEAAGLHRADIDDLLDGIAATAVPVTLAFLWRPAVRDPDDDMVLETAVNAGASAIVTFNRRDFGKVASRFGIAVLLPRDAVDDLESRQ